MSVSRNVTTPVGNGSGAAVTGPSCRAGATADNGEDERAEPAALGRPTMKYRFPLGTPAERKGPTMADAHAWDFFLVHSSRAKPRARELHGLLVAQGVNVFLDAETIDRGSTWDATLDGALRDSWVAVVLVSDSFDDAFYATEEVSMAISSFRQFGTPVVYPVYLDGMDVSDAPYGLNRVHGQTVATGESLDQLASNLMRTLRQVKTRTRPDDADAPAQSNLVVNWRGTETYRSIQQALDDAAPGAHIEISEGVYNESLTITQPVHLRGCGQIDKIIVQAFNGTAVTMTSDEATLEGLTIRQKGGTFQYQAIDIASGFPVIERCIISGGAHSAIRIRGAASPVIRENIIVGAALRGVELGDNAGVQLIGNWIDGLAEDGVWIGGKGQAVINDNVIDDCLNAGFHLEGDARVTARGNEINRCGDGIHLEHRSYASIQDNLIESSRRSGLRFDHEAAGIVTGNQIRRSQCEQVALSTSGSVTLEENLISAGRSIGAWVTPGATPTFTRNVIADNQGPGVGVATAASCHFYENQICRNTGEGVLIYGSDAPAVTVVRLNIIERNGSAGVRLVNGFAEVESNRIEANDGMGVEIIGGNVQCEHNSILLNRLAPLKVDCSTSSSMLRIMQNDMCAVDEQGVVDDPGIVVDTYNAGDGFLRIEGNWVHGCTTGIQLEYWGEGTTVIEGNFVDDNTIGVAVDVVSAESSGRPIIRANRCSRNDSVFTGPDEWVEYWSATNVAEDTVSEHMVKVRSLGLERRLEKLNPTNGSIALLLQRIDGQSDRVRPAN
jgi:parallel beta-helix repeat protein